MKPEMQIVFLRAMRRIYAKESSSVLTQIGHSKKTVKMMNEDYEELKEKQAMLKGVLEERRKPDLQDILSDNTKANAETTGDEVQVLVMEDVSEDKEEKKEEKEQAPPPKVKKIKKVLWVKTKTVPVDAQVISSMSALVTAANAFKKKKKDKKPTDQDTPPDPTTNAAVSSATEQTTQPAIAVAPVKHNEMKTTPNIKPITTNSNNTVLPTKNISNAQKTVEPDAKLGAPVFSDITPVEISKETMTNNLQQGAVTEIASSEVDTATRNDIDVTTPTDVTIAATSETEHNSDGQIDPSGPEAGGSDSTTVTNTIQSKGEPQLNPYQPLPGIGGKNPYPDDTTTPQDGAELPGEAASDDKKKKVIKKKKKVGEAGENEGADGDADEGADKKKKKVKKKKKLVAAANAVIATGIASGAEPVQPTEPLSNGEDAPNTNSEQEQQGENKNKGESFLPTIGTPKTANKHRPQSSVVPLPQIDATATDAGGDEKDITAVAEITVLSAEANTAPVLAVSHDTMAPTGAQQVV
ncbi:uncharacterized protein LOC106174986 [Lingula anatina]|uniref:Uncharacterized protein LOC106174986 n=1 Tax=Lingula anatina TaxID=7574 RepID=A0A1S3JQ38_LINAN|nr:uncharacterized protein LOC106174986 [Lingula anatina]|eukprot:XP_013412271.1 uncharacterized protein LOC106174986 [Lingula anatina]